MKKTVRGKIKSRKNLYCSFCGKEHRECRYFIAGGTVFICDECVELCAALGEQRKNNPNITHLANGGVRVDLRGSR